MELPVKNKLKRGLTTRHIRFIALGSAIGTGLFYGSADAIRMAGPSVLLAYLIGGVVAFVIMRALGEMSVNNPQAALSLVMRKIILGRWQVISPAGRIVLRS